MAGSATRAELEAIKLRKFRSLLRHARLHAPYYANIIRERGLDVDTCTPADFPVLTKTILMANFDAIVTDPRITKKVVADFLTRSSDPRERLFGKITVVHTSGTSGEVGYFLYAPADHALLLDRFRMKSEAVRCLPATQDAVARAVFSAAVHHSRSSIIALAGASSSPSPASTSPPWKCAQRTAAGIWTDERIGAS